LHIFIKKKRHETAFARFSAIQTRINPLLCLLMDSSARIKLSALALELCECCCVNSEHLSASCRRETKSIWRAFRFRGTPVSFLESKCILTCGVAALKLAQCVPVRRRTFYIQLASRKETATALFSTRTQPTSQITHNYTRFVLSAGSRHKVSL